MDTFISGHLSDGNALICGQCGCAPLVCVSMHSVVVLFVV